MLNLKSNPRVTQWLGAAFLLLLSAVFALMAFVRQVELEAARKIVHSGIEASATVTHMKCCSQIRMGTSKRSYITYRFPVGERQFWGTNREISPEKWAELRVGVQIPVRFDPVNPNRHIALLELAELELWTYRIGFSLLSLGFLTGCVLRLRNPRWKEMALEAERARLGRKS
jgi:hypothetical protein